jgi:acyl carrier protein
MDNENYTSLDEFNSYRLKMAEVHEQFLQMQMDANRIYERMLFNDGTAVPVARPQTPQRTVPVSAPAYQMPQPVAPTVQYQAPVAPAPVLPRAAAPVPPTQIAAPAPAPRPSLISSMFEKQESPSVDTMSTAIRQPGPGATRAATAIKDFLIQIVAEKTGFPEDMITLDMDMENDLAVDSIRRVEILGAVQENFPEAPVIGPEQLGILKTLNDIVNYLGVNDISPAATVARPAAANATPAQSGGTSAGAISAFLISTVAEKTGFPEDMITPDMDLENDLAVDSIRRVEILGAVQEKFPDAPTVGPEQLGILKTLKDIISFLSAGSASTAGPVAEKCCNTCADNGFRSFLISTVAEKTGFPEDMITLDMDLENDLAVDSIRRVEILGAMQERFPDAPTVGPEQLGVLKTLADIIGFLESGKKKSLMA